VEIPRHPDKISPKTRTRTVPVLESLALGKSDVEAEKKS
jgi:hypothetical protein